MFRSIPRLPVAAIVIVTAIAACGSNSRSSSGSGGQPTQAQIQQAERDAVRFADCMRSHGTPNFPDSPYEQKMVLSSSDAQSPAVQSGVTACRQVLPHGGQSQTAAPSHAQTVALLAFARCLRGHGFPNFPDPTSSGQVTHEMIANAGIDLHQPAVLQAADDCVSVTHGVITKAIVARFVREQ
jgi:hypothetical protein